MPRKMMEDMKIHKTDAINRNSYLDNYSPAISSKPKPKPESIPKLESKITNINSANNFNINSGSSSPKGKSISFKKVFWTILFILLLSFLTYWYATKFQKADVVINVKHSMFSLNNKPFTASKTGQNTVSFEITINSDKETKDITLTKSENVAQKAKGSVTMYNSYTTKPQKILVNTFVEDNSGKAYRLDSSVNIPGYKVDKGVIIPGQADVGITAFLDGQEYNGSPADFKITAFKNTPKEKKIYAKLKTSLSGGAKGLVYKLNDKDLADLNTYASNTFKNNLYAKMSALVPKGYILYPNASVFSYQIDDTIISKTPDTKVVITGSISSIIFKEKDLSVVVLHNLFPSMTEKDLTPIQIPNLPKLTFNFTNKNQTITKDLQSVPFTLTGDLDAVWHPDTNAIKSGLAGIPKESTQAVFQKDSGISSASVKIFPVWQSHLPYDASRINIMTQ